MKGYTMELIDNLFSTSAWCFVLSLCLLKITDLYPSPEWLKLCMTIILLVSSVSTVVLSFMKILA